MKTRTLWIALLLIAGGAAWWFYRRQEPPTSPAPARAARKVLYYQDPMHPAYTSDKPGKAPDCGMDLVPVYADEGQASEAMPPRTVRINLEKQQLIGVQYGQVEMRHLRRKVRAVGKLAYDETRIARIHSKIDGWIEQMMVDFTGQEVKKGQPLLTIYSPELYATQQEFLLAVRARQELAGSPSPAAVSGAQNLYAAARRRLELWDISDEQIQQIEQQNQPVKALTLYSPISGFVTARNAYPRQRVTPDTELYTVADLSTVWALAEVYEYEIPLMRVGQPATMTLTYLPGVQFSGKVTYLYPQLDPMTRTLKVRLEFPNPDYRLRPDMFASVELSADLGRQLAVPEEAVLDSGAEQTVFVDRGDGYLEPRTVVLGERVEGWFSVRKGLTAGERVVTSGNFLVDSESRLKSAVSAIAGHQQHGGSPPAGAQPAAKPSESKPPAAAPPGGHKHD